MPTYRELLESPDWKTKREQIIKRDYHTCQKCNNHKLLDARSLAIANFPKRRKDFTVYSLSEYHNPPEEYKTLFIPNRLNIPDIDLVIYFSIENNNIKLLAARISYPDDPYRLMLFHNKEMFDKEKLGFGEIFKLESELNDNQITNALLNQSAFEKFENYDWLYIAGLHVHHTYYQDSLLPWQYPQSALTTLCWYCHEEFHSNQKVKHLDKEGTQIGYLTPCFRCHGAGYFPEYFHVEQGICFRCEGAKYEELISNTQS
jgi:hypothetical protein